MPEDTARPGDARSQNEQADTRHDVRENSEGDTQPSMQEALQDESLGLRGQPQQRRTKEQSDPKPTGRLWLPLRDHDEYATGMNAGVDVKQRDIIPNIPSDAAVIVDVGCGPGGLIKQIGHSFPNAKIIGLELKPELRKIARDANKDNPNVSIVPANVLEKQLGADKVDAVILSSVAHEFRSYSKEDRAALERALLKLHDHLRPGGRLIIRDPVSPGFEKSVWMKCDKPTEELFLKFAREFRPNSAQPGVPYRTHSDENGQTWYRLSEHHLNEFLLHKNYPHAWAAEMHEEYGTYDLAGWKTALEKSGFEVIEARQYLHPWIRDEWYKGKVDVRTDDDGRPGKWTPYPASNMVMVAEAVKVDHFVEPEIELNTIAIESRSRVLSPEAYRPVEILDRLQRRTRSNLGADTGAEGTVARQRYVVDYAIASGSNPNMPNAGTVWEFKRAPGEDAVTLKNRILTNDSIPWPDKLAAIRVIDTGQASNLKVAETLRLAQRETKARGWNGTFESKCASVGILGLTLSAWYASYKMNQSGDQQYIPPAKVH